jgi:hypothetical protein
MIMLILIFLRVELLAIEYLFLKKKNAFIYNKCDIETIA